MFCRSSCLCSRSLHAVADHVGMIVDVGRRLLLCLLLRLWRLTCSLPATPCPQPQARAARRQAMRTARAAQEPLPAGRLPVSMPIAFSHFWRAAWAAMPRQARVQAVRSAMVSKPVDRCTGAMTLPAADCRRQVAQRRIVLMPRNWVSTASRTSIARVF